MLSLLTVGLVGALALADPAAPAPSSSLSPAHYLLLNAPERRVRAPEARVRSLARRRSAPVAHVRLARHRAQPAPTSSSTSKR